MGFDENFNLLMIHFQREPVLRKELGKVRSPIRTFLFRTRIWLPSHWVITKIYQGEVEVVPTVIVDTPAATRPRQDPNEVHCHLMSE